jgi:FkbM family methyltransferase
MNALELMEYFELPVYGIIHVGANTGQERNAYRLSGAAFCLYIEPVSAVFHELQKNISGIPGHVAIQAACSDVDGKVVTLNIASNAGESSSILPMSEHARLFPNVRYVGHESITTRTLDSIVRIEVPGKKFNLLVIDAQGADLKVLQGARFLLPHLDGVFVEVSEIPFYEGGCTLGEVTGFLRSFDFRMKWMKIGRYRYGDAFYLQRDARTLPPVISENIALGKPSTQSSLSVWSKPADAQGGNNGLLTGGFGFHTGMELNPWWQVDLGREQPIREIRIFNRLDTCSDRACSLRVLLSTDEVHWHLVHDQGGKSFGGIDGCPLQVFPQQASARFVRLQLNETEYLHLDEIEIY